MAHKPCEDLKDHRTVDNISNGTDGDLFRTGFLGPEDVTKHVLGPHTFRPKAFRLEIERGSPVSEGTGHVPYPCAAGSRAEGPPGGVATSSSINHSTYSAASFPSRSTASGQAARDLTTS